MKTVLAAITMVGLSVPAGAQMVSSANPKSVADAMHAGGYRAELSKDSEGDPIIRSSAAGADFSVFFYGCEKGATCGEIQFWAGWTDKPSLERVNEWNRKHRFGRAYLDDKGEINLEYDINLEGAGIPIALFKNDLELWDTLVGDFRNFLASDGK